MANKLELRKLNRNIVYRCIYDNDGVSRQDIAANTSLSIPTVIQNLSELEEQGLISTDGVFESTGGRRAKVIRPVLDARLSVGIDITANHVTITILDLKGQIVAGGKREELRYTDNAEYYTKVAGKLADLIHKHHFKSEQILGVGISVPCIVDRKTNELSYSKVIDAPKDLYREFADRIPYHLEIFNDANAGGYAEMWQKDKDCDTTIFYLMLSNSVGGSVIGPNGIYQGDNCRSAEIGHIRIEPHGRRCYCGQIGCVNAYCSAKLLADTRGGRLEDFFEDLEKGDKELEKLFDDYLDHLALTVVNLRMLYDCEVVLGGYVGVFMEKYMDRIRSKVEELDPYDSGADFLIPCKYKNEASAVGAGLTFVDEYIRNI